MNKRTGLYLAVKGESGLVKKNEREEKKMIVKERIEKS